MFASNADAKEKEKRRLANVGKEEEKWEPPLRRDNRRKGPESDAGLMDEEHRIISGKIDEAATAAKMRPKQSFEPSWRDKKCTM